MFKIETIQKDHRSGQTTRRILAKSYKSRTAAERAAEHISYVTKPDGKTPTTSVEARVIPTN